ncbi:MAG: C40 family peptidase [Actinobacteria bacterium]|nr:C40 family peptidase [Actinomycetota bacterium]
MKQLWLGLEMGRAKVVNRAGIVVVAFVAIAMLAVLTPGPEAFAVPDDLASKSTEAARIAQEIDAMDNQLAIATETYDQVKVQLDEINTKVDETRRQLFQIRLDLKERRSLLNDRVVYMYKNGRTSMFEVLLETSDFGDFLEQAEYVSRVTNSDADLIERIIKARESVEELEAKLEEEQRAQQALVEKASFQKNLITQGLASRQAILDSLNEDIERLLQEELQRQQATDQQINEEAQENLSDLPSGGIAKTAMRYLGVVYHWAGAGPGKCPTGEHRICFDCSGLTQYVYKLFGIDIPHNAAMQFNKGQKITLKQAKPGDLVFFGMPPHHVGMYLGNDMFLHAPRTGDVVKVSRLSERSDLSGICRFTKD